MSSVTNNNIAPGETVGVDWDSLQRTAKERLAPGFSYAGDVTPGEAWQILADDTNAVLVDVRTDADFLAALSGHVAKPRICVRPGARRRSILSTSSFYMP